MSTFYSWMKKQSGRDDPIGDLGGNAMRTGDAPRSSSLMKWHDHLREHRAERSIHALLDEA